MWVMKMAAWTEAVRRRPYQVILFDEIEKAHPDIFNVLLQVLDEGQLTDGQGRRVDFRNTIILLTSNIGSEHLLALAEHERFRKSPRQVMADVASMFRPEFINRLDRALLFRRLSRDDMAAIVDLQLKDLSHRLHDQHIEIDVTDDARLWLGDQGYDPQFGARPLKRVIQNEIHNALAMGLIDGRFGEGDLITIDLDKAEDKLSFTHRQKQTRLNQL